ncbi:hypothetical protein M8494_19885 [Serratia ureilytica]
MTVLHSVRSSPRRSSTSRARTPCKTWRKSPVAGLDARLTSIPPIVWAGTLHGCVTAPTNASSWCYYPL